MHDDDVAAEIRSIVGGARVPMSAVDIWNALVARDRYTEFQDVNAALKACVKSGQLHVCQGRYSVPKTHRPAKDAKPSIAMRIDALVSDLRELNLMAAELDDADVCMGIGSLMRVAARLQRDLEAKWPPGP